MFFLNEFDGHNSVKSSSYIDVDDLFIYFRGYTPKCLVKHSIVHFEDMRIITAPGCGLGDANSYYYHMYTREIFPTNVGVFAGSLYGVCESSFQCRQSFAGRLRGEIHGEFKGQKSQQSTTIRKSTLFPFRRQ